MLFVFCTQRETCHSTCLVWHDRDKESVVSSIAGLLMKAGSWLWARRGTFKLVVAGKVLKLVGVGPLADVALLVHLLHMEEELRLPKKTLVAKPTNTQMSATFGGKACCLVLWSAEKHNLHIGWPLKPLSARRPSASPKR